MRISRSLAILGLACLTLAGCGESSQKSPSASGPIPPRSTAIHVLKGKNNQTYASPQPQHQPGHPLAAFFEALDGLENGRQPNVTVVQLGDSHTAGDRFSGRLRELMQTRFGNAGRGMLPPGVPYDGYRPTQVAVYSSGWNTSNSWTSKTPGPYGITGFLAQGRSPNDVMAVETKDDNNRFDFLAVGFLRQPGGGTLVIKADGAEVGRIATDGAMTGSEMESIEPPNPTRRFEVSPAGDGPVTLLSWTVQRNARGVVWDSQGISGSVISVMDRWNADAVTRDLSIRNPALVVLVYGTNEGFGDNLKEDQYGADLVREITLIRNASPDAAILLVTPPDGERLPAGCPGAFRADVHYPCAPLVEGDPRLHVRGKAKGALCRWYTPPKLAMVRAVQAKVSAQQGLALWDWSSIMPPVCGAHAWTQAVPPLTRGDHVHMTTEGYGASADALFKYLMSEYDGWRAGKPAAVTGR